MAKTIKLLQKKLIKSSLLRPVPLLIAAIILIISAYTLYAYYLSNRAKISEVTTGDACSYTFSIPTPTPSPNPSPSPSTPSTGECRIRFEYENHQNSCEQNPQTKTITYYVDQLPPGGPYYMQTDWYVAAPVAGPNHYEDTQRIEAGKAYTFTYDWPGISSYNPTPDTLEIHLGLNVVDADKNILTPACAKGLDIYWTKWTVCP